MEALLGVVPREKSVAGEIVSAGDGLVGSAVYGGGGDTIGSASRVSSKTLQEGDSALPSGP